MRAVVLVGGFGTRLRPLTATVPKPMLPVGHRPILERLVEQLGSAGVTEVVLALGFKPEPFIDAFPDGTCAGVRLAYAVEPEPLDTAGAIRFAVEHAQIDETFVVMNGDVLTDLDVSVLVAFHRERGAEATLHLTPVDDPSAYGVVELDGVGRVRRFVEKPAPGTAPSNFVNAGTYVLEPSVLGHLEPGTRSSIEREIFPLVAERETLFALATDDYWIDTGRPETYLQANLDLLDGRRRSTCEAVAPGADVHPGATVVDSVVGPGAVIADGARVERSVVLTGSSIGAGALVRSSVTMGSVGTGAMIDDVVLGAGASIAAGAVRSHSRIPEPDPS
jgi:mannose-1-phosphate guanylyltransferase